MKYRIAINQELTGNEVKELAEKDKQYGYPNVVYSCVLDEEISDHEAVELLAFAFRLRQNREVKSKK